MKTLTIQMPSMMFDSTVLVTTILQKGNMIRIEGQPDKRLSKPLEEGWSTDGRFGFVGGSLEPLDNFMQIQHVVNHARTKIFHGITPEYLFMVGDGETKPLWVYYREAEKKF